MEKDKLLEIAGHASKLLQEGLDRLPYSANAIDELHANENAHSRLLRMFLQYNGGRTWPVYRTFLKLIKDRCSSFPFDCHNPIFANEEGRIDLLITDNCSNQKWAIIVENKVCEAGDQDEQRARYINKTEAKGIPKQNIFVIYLTSDGTKKASSYSLTDEAKQKLCFKNEVDKGRYIELNYRYDILPWIEKEVLLNVAIKEELLISSLKLYIDYLKGMFELRNDEQIIHNKIQKIMAKELQINTLQDGFKKKDDIIILQNEIDGIIKEKAFDILEIYLQKPLEKFLANIGGELLDLDYYSDTQFRCIIGMHNWQKVLFKIEPSNGNIYGICHKDINDQLAPDTINKLNELFPRPIYNSTPWYPVWSNINSLHGSAGTRDVWNSIESGELYKKLEEWLREAQNKTKDMLL